MLNVIDFDGGNIGSVMNCLSRLAIPHQRVTNPKELSADNPILFPGVGAFGATMNRLNSAGLSEAIISRVKAGTPYLGICIGLQVLFESSQESPETKGLGLISGEVVKFQANSDAGKAPLKIPQIGWNWITRSKTADGNTEHHNQPDGFWPNGYVYFVNSFYPKPQDASCVLYTANYGEPFVAAVQYKNITAFQFHPEKSSQFGQNLIATWYQSQSLEKNIN
ncbi:MAG: imidazole glycerol phosphate synthase subunit HisH [Cyanobacteria bacterium P01_H01_bin.74]